MTVSVRLLAPELIPNMQGDTADDMEPHNTMATDVYAFALVCYEVNHIVKMSPGHVTEQDNRCSVGHIPSLILRVTSESCLPWSGANGHFGRRMTYLGIVA
jgi:hypothetical protein